MSDAFGPQSGSAGDPLPRELTRDLDALASASHRAASTLAETARRVAAREAERGNRKMNENRGRGLRPAWGIAAAVAAIAAVLLFVPVSFDRTVGQELQFTVSGTQLAAADVQDLLSVLRQCCGDGPVGVEAGEVTTIETKFRGKTRAEVEAVAAALQKELAAKGVTASYEVKPWTQEVSSSVYAHAAAQLRDLTVTTAGRSEAEIESDIRSQLQTMGFLNPDVSYSRTADGSEMHLEAEDADGHKIVAKAHHKTVGGDPSLEPDMNILMIDPAELKGKSDAEIRTIVEQKLAERGITDAKITVENGAVKVEAKQEIHK